MACFADMALGKLPGGSSFGNQIDTQNFRIGGCGSAEDQPQLQRELCFFLMVILGIELASDLALRGQGLDISVE